MLEQGIAEQELGVGVAGLPAMTGQLHTLSATQAAHIQVSLMMTFATGSAARRFGERSKKMEKLIADELGLSAVVATSAATSTLRDGDIGTIDANTERVERVGGAVLASHGHAERAASHLSKRTKRGIRWPCRAHRRVSPMRVRSM